MIVVIFRARTKSSANLNKLGALVERLCELVTNIPGFISVKDFLAQDGEAVFIAEFASLESINAWKNHPEHLAAKRQGREDFFADYQVQICDVISTQKLTN